MTHSRTATRWALVGSAVTGLVWAWRRDHESRQGAERLAAATLEVLLNAIDANDEVTGQHVRRTAAYALCLAEAIGLAEVERRKVERVALFHDIGKIHAALFDIVHDESRLSDSERTLIATHAERGAEVLAPLAAFYPELPEGVLAHHERWDGKGYPRGLKGDAIPLYARIVTIADTFDAITHSRRYHAAEGAERGAAVIAEGRGTQFDPQLVDHFLSPTTFAGVQRTCERTRRRAANAPARRGERRVQAGDFTVPDVRFRWRTPPTPTAVVPPPPAGDAPGGDVRP